MRRSGGYYGETESGPRANLCRLREGSCGDGFVEEQDNVRGRRGRKKGERRGVGGGELDEVPSGQLSSPTNPCNGKQMRVSVRVYEEGGGD